MRYRVTNNFGHFFPPGTIVEPVDREPLTISPTRTARYFRGEVLGAPLTQVLFDEDVEPIPD